MNPLVFVHGFKGARLTGPAGRIDWLTGTMALGLRTPHLGLAARFEQGRQPDDGRRPAGPLEKVVVVPRLIEEPVYAPFLDALRSSGRPWRAFAYDWRRDNFESAERLAACVADVRKEHGGSPVDIIAHSNGSLVTLGALHAGLEGVESIVFAGAPFAGGVGFLDDMHAGTASGLNKKVLSPAVVATFPSVYCFFPLRGARLLDENGAALEIDLLRAESWQQHRLGVYQRPSQVEDSFGLFLEEALARARRFRELLETRLTAYPHIKVLVGTGHSTLAAIRRRNGAATPEWDIQNGVREDGDGRVLAIHALPPEKIPFERFESKLAHGDLLNDPLVSSWLQAQR